MHRSDEFMMLRMFSKVKKCTFSDLNEILGIGLVTKKAKNHFEWVGGDVDSNGQVEPDELELQRFESNNF